MGNGGSRKPKIEIKMYLKRYYNHIEMTESINTMEDYKSTFQSPDSSCSVLVPSLHPFLTAKFCSQVAVIAL